MRPPSGRSRPPTMRSVVVLPQPLGPSSVNISPRRISRLERSTALAVPNSLVTSSSCRTVSLTVPLQRALLRPRGPPFADRRNRARKVFLAPGWKSGPGCALVSRSDAQQLAHQRPRLLKLGKSRFRAGTEIVLTRPGGAGGIDHGKVG